MPSADREFDCLIFGGGLAGSIFAWTLIENGKQPIVIDDRGKSRCSEVAAGLINPIGGKRLNLVWEANTHIPFAIELYKLLGTRFRSTFFHQRDIARIFADDDERILWNRKNGRPDFKNWTADLSEVELPRFVTPKQESGFAIKGTGFVDIPNLLDRIRKELRENGALSEKEFNYHDIDCKTDLIRWNGYSAPFAVFAEGHFSTENPWFSFVPYRPAKGVIGRIKSDIQLPNTIILEKRFLIPRDDGSIHIGATYDWDSRDEKPDEKGVAELESFLYRFLGNQWKWIEKTAGIRPSTPGAKPVVGRHPEFSNIFSFNGFGSKGATQTPFLAKELHDHIWKSKSLSSEVTPSRFVHDSSSLSKRWIAVEIARDRVLEIIQPGDTVIDATAGNGHDALWLAKAVGTTGHVFAYDIQSKAIMMTRDRLKKQDALSQTTLIHDCHSTLKRHLPMGTKPNAIIFNLGYLPKGDKTIVTKTATTLKALAQSLSVLRPGGILSVVLYPGHQEGENESNEILEWSKGIDQNSYKTEIVTNPTRNRISPLVLFVQTQ